MRAAEDPAGTAGARGSQGTAQVTRERLVDRGRRGLDHGIERVDEGEVGGHVLNVVGSAGEIKDSGVGLPPYSGRKYRPPSS